MVSRIKKIKNKDSITGYAKIPAKKVFKTLKLVEPDSNLKQDLYQIVAPI
jgi:hypothetical protein